LGVAALKIFALLFLQTVSFSPNKYDWKYELTTPTTTSETRGVKNSNKHRKCWDNNEGNVPTQSDDGGIVRHSPCAGLKTLEEIMNRMELPCDYVHDGLYLKDSNAVLGEVYLALKKMFIDSERLQLDPSRVVPVIAEIGGHDGITKSISLKSSRCLHTNTLLIEASPSNYAILRQSRAYDTTVNAALCESGGSFVSINENPVNSGESKLVDSNEDLTKATAKIPCTTLDDEIEAMRRTLPDSGKEYEMKLVFLVLDVEGNEAMAVKGINKYIPSKAMIEVKMQKNNPVGGWATSNSLVGTPCGSNGSDTCYNYSSDKNALFPRNVFYGARKSIPKNTYKTSAVSPAYMYYGE